MEYLEGTVLAFLLGMTTMALLYFSKREPRN